MPSSHTPSALAASEWAFAQWATAALVDIRSPDNKPSVIEEEEKNLMRFCLPKALQTHLTSVKNDNGEDPKTKKFAEDLLTSFDGQFTSDTDDYDLRYTWRELATLQNNLDFVISNQDPPPNVATSRCPVDVLLTQVMKVVAKKQNSKAMRYDHEVSMSMSKTYISETPFVTSLNMICDGMASYRLPQSTETAINRFAAEHRIPMEVTISSEHIPHGLCLSLCMLAVEYKANNEQVALFQLLMDFATILRHRRLLGFEQKHLLGTTGWYTSCPIAYCLNFYLGTLDDRGQVQHWNVGTLNIMNPAELLKAYVWIANSITQFYNFAKVWQFDSNAPRDLEKLVWRAGVHSSSNAPGLGSRKRRRCGKQGSRPASSECQQQVAGGDAMDVSDPEADSGEFDASDEQMENDCGRETAMSDPSFKIPYYTASELIRVAVLDEENDKATSEAREHMRAQQGEIPPDLVVQRYLDSLQTDDGVSPSVDNV